VLRSSFRVLPEPSQARETARFAMLLHIPNEARLGRTGLFWLLDPKTYLPTTAVAGVLVTR